jgi:hypothetical protein
MDTTRTLLRPIVLVLLLLALAPPDASGQSSAASLASMKVVVQELQVLLNRAIIGADHAAATKIEAASAEASRVLRLLEKFEEKVAKDANASIDEPIRAMHQLMADTRSLVRSTERRLFLDVNQLLVQSAGLLDALPLVGVEPYVAALDPVRIASEGFDRKVSVYGFFGNRNEERLPRVRFAGMEVEMKRQPGGVFFTLPTFPQGLPEQTYVALEVLVPVRKGIFKTKGWKSIHDRLYVERTEPYTCTLRSFVPNPDYEVMVDADVELTDWAATQGGKGRPSNHRTVSAEDLFIATVSTAMQNYVPSSARIQEPRARFWGNAACQDHAGWSGQLVRWNSDLVEFSLSAPDIGPHTHSRTRRECPWTDTPFGRVQLPCFDVPEVWVHGGGGSHANVGLKPRFLVRRAGVEPKLEQGTEQRRIARGKVVEIPMAINGADWSIHVTCDYQDGDERESIGPLVLGPTDAEEVAPWVSARWSEGRLYLGTASR